jgi:hypothetical protein
MHTFTTLQIVAAATAILLSGGFLGVITMALVSINRQHDTDMDIHFMEHHGLGLHVRLHDGNPMWWLVDVTGTAVGRPSSNVRGAIENVYGNS